MKTWRTPTTTMKTGLPLSVARLVEAILLPWTRGKERMTVKRIFISVVLAVFVLSRGSALAQEMCIPLFIDPTRHTPSFLYVHALMDSFHFAKVASDRYTQALETFLRDMDRLRNKPDATRADINVVISTLTYEVKVAGEDYLCAASMLEKFKRSDIEAIRGSAEAAHTVYTTLAKIDREILSEMSRNNSDRVTDLSIAKNQTWKTLVLAGVMTTHALVEVPKDPNERLNRLSITRSERVGILKRLKEIFGLSITGGLQAGQTSLEAAGATIYEFLSERGWKALDE